LIFLALVWKDDRAPLWRYSFIVFGGLSSPAILPASLLFATRAAVQRTRTELVAALLACCIAAVQTMPLLSSTIMRAGFPSLHSVAVGGLTLGVPLLAVLTAAAIWRSEYTLSLIGLLALAISIMSIFRVDLGGAHPLYSGPRYYFYPYITIAWLAISLAAGANLLSRSVLLASIVIVVLAAATFETGATHVGFSRRHERFDWRGQLDQCGRQPLRIMTDGSNTWPVDVTADQCAWLLNNSLFR